MESWYVYTIIALFAFGIQRFLYKVSAEKKCNTAWTTFSFMGTVTVLSTILFFTLHETVSNLSFLLFVSLINSISFLAGTITTIEALKHISITIAYPIIRLNTGIVVIFSILYFNDSLSFYQVAGIIMAISVILILTRYSNNAVEEISDKNIRVGFALIFIALFSGAVAAISSKFASIHTNLLGFISISYALSTLFSLGLQKRLQQKDVNPNHRNALIIGLGMGLVNFVGFYSLLKALSVGPLSIIISITGLYFVIAIVLSALIYRERLNFLRIAGIVLTVISIIFMRI